MPQICDFLRFLCFPMVGYGKWLEMQSVRKFGALLAVLQSLVMGGYGRFLGRVGKSEKFAVGVSGVKRV